MPFRNGKYYIKLAVGRVLEKAREILRQNKGRAVNANLRPDESQSAPGDLDSDTHCVTMNGGDVLIYEPEGRGAGTTARQPDMSLSEKGLWFIERHEGYSGTAYGDSAGNPTIGYGHLIREGEDFSTGITKDEASALLAQDVEMAVGAVNANLKVKIWQNEFDALVDFTYNLGEKNLANSALLSNINAGQAVTASDFTDYNHAGSRIVPGLTTRRTDEFILFSKGDYGGR